MTEIEGLRGEAMKYLELDRYMTREEYEAFKALVDRIVELRIEDAKERGLGMTTETGEYLSPWALNDRTGDCDR